MSNATQNSRNSGDSSRRRRSRGGQNRRNNNNSEERNQQSGGSEGGSRDGDRQQGNRNGRQNSGGQAERRRMPTPVKLTWWQKLLQAVGLYKEPVRPPRPERRPDTTEPVKTREPRRQKTRDARSESTRGEKAPTDPATHSYEREERVEAPRRGKRGERNDRGERNERGGRGERDSNRPRGGDASTVESRRVYVGNLSYDVTESDLEELFKGVGAVRRVEIVYNRSTHRSKGYGFIEMIDIDEAKRTVEILHDQFFMGRKLTVSGAKSKDHEDAERDEQSPPSGRQEMPTLAPLNPARETVTPLVEEAPAEQPAAEIETAEPIGEIPTEEFTPEGESEEETKNQSNF